ncbi:MAG: hypothetical protein MMC33_001940 [Icmadophila ericetorum]|nr:hypothetical protein [Icmadophila ericetorum]
MTNQETQAPTTVELVHFSGDLELPKNAPDLPSEPATHGPQRYHEKNPVADGSSDEDNLKSGLYFNHTVSKVMKIQEGYQEVSVLMVKWADKLEDLKTRPELEELEKLFLDTFKFNTRVVELDNSKGIKPQRQLELAVAEGLIFDGPHRLLIVYYTGHGMYDETKGHLELYPNLNEDLYNRSQIKAHAIWNKAEEPLMDPATECDVLAVMDTCFAGSISRGLSKKEDGNTYQMLTASGNNKQTPGPGKKSFTRALIESLKELLEMRKDRPFTLQELRDKIDNYRQKKGFTENSQIINRLKNYDHSVTLTPLKENTTYEEQDFKFVPTRSILTLDLSLKQETLSENDIRNLAEALSLAVKNTYVKRISWVYLKTLENGTTISGLVFSRILAKTYFRHWKAWIAWKRNNGALREKPRLVTVIELFQKFSKHFAPDPSPSESRSEANPQTPSKRKRSNSEEDLNEPKHKRFSPELSEQHQRPLTPMSDIEKHSGQRNF